MQEIMRRGCEDRTRRLGIPTACERVSLAMNQVGWIIHIVSIYMWVLLFPMRDVTDGMIRLPAACGCHGRGLGLGRAGAGG
jgi:hypothetical protein